MVDEKETKGVPMGAPLAARPRGDRSRLEVSRGSMIWDIDECAAVLAYMLPGGARRFGRKTIHRTLAEAAQRGLTARRAANQADPDLIEHYRRQLVDFHFFSQEDLDWAILRGIKGDQKEQDRQAQELEQAEKDAINRESRGG